jgi:hypothetical protein
VRLVVAILLTAGALAASARAGAVEPKVLVLRSGDVPAGFVVDAQDTGVRTNEGEADSNRTGRALIARLGRVTGYEAEWNRERGQESIVSRADVFRTASGSQRYVELSAAMLSRSGIKGIRRDRMTIGDGGYLFHGGSSGELAWVLWRSGRVAGMVVGWGVPRGTTVALARAQQRRIAAALG